MDRDHKKNKALLGAMAKEDPNKLLAALYTGYKHKLSLSDLKDLVYLINLARKAQGYQEDRDFLKKEGII